MASTSTKRPGAPGTLTPHAKPVISVEEWEAKAPLGEAETRSVNLVKGAAEKAALPLKFALDEPGSSSRPSTPVLRNKLGGGSRPGTPTLAFPRSTTASALHPKQPIQTPQQFYDWFALIDRSVAHSQEANYRAHLESVSEHLETCDRLIQRIDEVDTAVDGMLDEWRLVEEGGKSLKGACEQLLEERDRLLSITDAIDERLGYFQELEHATRMLNHPGDSLVLQTEFLYMVERVDVCIEYLKAHRHFREAEIYLLRFQQCMTRAMTLIKMFFVGSLKALTVDVTKRMGEKDVSATAQMHLLYTRFYTVSGQLAPLLAELERRAAAHPEELMSLLSECHAAYFAARKGLLVSRLQEEIKGLDPTRTELVELTRTGCSYLKQLCMDEFNLFRALFNSGEDQLYAYLESLCDYLYDDLRPRILHEPRLTALCEVCTVLQALMVLDVPVLGDEQDDDEYAYADELNLDLRGEARRPGKRGLRALHIGYLLQMVLQDAQTRLFFKAQSVIQSEIRYYVPKAEDLDYPQRLIAARKPVTGLEIREKESVSQLFQLKSLDKQDTWYPTLRKTVWVLSQLHDFVKPAIFDEIAREAVNLCLQSLISAAQTLKSKLPSESTLDVYLFLVRHLLILKEMTQNLDLENKSTDRPIDLSGVTETLASVLGRTSSYLALPNALLTSLGIQNDGDMTDIRRSLDQELKASCEMLIKHSAGPVTVLIRLWTDVHRNRKATRPLGASSIAGARAAEPRWGQPRLSPEGVNDLWARLKVVSATELRKSVHKLRLYLEDERTVSVLLGHIQERIVDDWAEWRRAVREIYPIGSAVQVDVGTEDLVRAMVRSACDEHSGPAAGPSV
ncbi:Sec34-like family-domain-containing protein [Fomitopsis betulina]|nr:Sec34-like family-domain-containing protein [Fomitopsis betulina]